MTDIINVMINGLPGNVAQKMAIFAHNDTRFNLVPYSLTGPEIDTGVFHIDDRSVTLIKPDVASLHISEIKEKYHPIMIDYTHPSAVNTNALFYVKHGLAFVMGTTGGDREKLISDAQRGSMPSVIAPNMAKQIVGLQAMIEYGAKNFPNLFDGYTLRVKESHQKEKADTSGTAKIMVQYFNQLGLDFSEDDIEIERNTERQEKIWGIPQQYLSGHGWHTYTIESPDQTALFEITHNINGRDIYVKGTFDAVLFLYDRIKTLETNHKLVYTMIDVLRGS